MTGPRRASAHVGSLVNRPNCGGNKKAGLPSHVGVSMNILRSKKYLSRAPHCCPHPKNCRVTHHVPPHLSNHPHHKSYHKSSIQERKTCKEFTLRSQKVIYDYDSLGGVVGDLEQCKTACKASSECKAFVYANEKYVDGNGRRSGKPQCWLKTATWGMRDVSPKDVGAMDVYEKNVSCTNN